MLPGRRNKYNIIKSCEMYGVQKMQRILFCIVILGCVQSGFSQDCMKVAENELTVLSVNVGIFPGSIMALYPDRIKDKKSKLIEDEEERAKALADALIAYEGKPDVLLFQEIWSVKARDVLVAALATTYPYCVHPEEALFSMQQSGLMIFSKHELSGFEYKEFTAGIGLDKVASKGIIGAWLTKAGRKVAVFTTHLQAGGKRDPSVKPAQLDECNTFIREFTQNDKDAIIILTGDFNTHSTDPEAYNTIFEHLDGAVDTYADDCSKIKGSTRKKDQPLKRIDYILVFGGVKAKSIIVDPAGDMVTDHLAVFGTVALD